MATVVKVVEVKNMNSQGLSCVNDVVILLSDEEDEEEDSQKLLSAFVTAIERYVAKEVVVLLLTKFDEASTAFVTSSAFKQTLRRFTKVVTQENAFIHTGKVCKELMENKDGEINQDKNQFKYLKRDRREEDTRTETKDEREERNMAGNFENQNADKSSYTLESRESRYSAEKISDSDDFVEIVSANVKAKKDHSVSKKKGFKSDHQTSVLNLKTNEISKDQSKRKLKDSPRKRRKMIKILEQKLKYIDERIKILNQTEISLAEMELGDSTYIQESRLKEKFNQIWNEICRLQGRPPETGRVVEKSIKCKTTGYPEIDRAVKKFLEKSIGFPDVFDVRNVITRAIKKHSLKIPSQMLQELVEEVFTDIGNKMQKRRKRDFEYNFGCELTDTCVASRDPAMHDTELRKKLEKNKRKGKRALNKVFEKFVHINRHRQHKLNCSSSSNSDGEQESVQVHTSRLSNGVKAFETSRFNSESRHESSSEDDEQNIKEKDDFEVDLNESQDVNESQVITMSAEFMDDDKFLGNENDSFFDEDGQHIDRLNSAGACSPEVQQIDTEESSRKEVNHCEVTKATSSTSNEEQNTALFRMKNKKMKSLSVVIESIKSQNVASCKNFRKSYDDHPQVHSNDVQPSLLISENGVDSPIAGVTLDAIKNSDNMPSKEVPAKLPDDLNKRDNSALKISTGTGIDDSTTSVSVASSTTTSKKRTASPDPLPFETPVKLFRTHLTNGTKSAQSKNHIIDLTSPGSECNDKQYGIASMSRQTESEASCSVEKQTVKPNSELEKQECTKPASVDVIVID